MTEKRFKIGYVYGVFGLIDNDEWIDLHSMSENSEKNVQICINKMNELSDENEQLKDKYNEQSVQYEGLEEQVERLLDFKDNVFNLIDELIKKAEKDVEDLRKDAYEKGYAYNPYYYWGVAHGLEKLKEELKMND